MYDSIIVGGGAAGMSAAIYLVRKKLEVLLISPDFGGQAAKSSEIENYLGFTKITGPELMQKFSEHIEALGVQSKMEEVEKITKTENGFLLETPSGQYETKSVLLASGKMPRHLDVPGEEEFSGRGVCYCAVCDGPLFHDKTVAVIGGGNSALDAALEIEKYAKKVYLVNLDEDFKGDEIRKDKVKASEKIELITNAKTKEFFGEGLLKGMKYIDKTGAVKELAIDGAFVEIGWTPATGLVEGLVELNDLKEIKIDLENRTSVPGIFAAGDVTDVREKQIIIAAGEGAKAALNAWSYIVLEHAKK
ncbi:MAG: FAD-dependent oxidoreductase [Candidatus Berkelbacteria bacterium]